MLHIHNTHYGNSLYGIFLYREIAFRVEISIGYFTLLRYRELV